MTDLECGLWPSMCRDEISPGMNMHHVEVLDVSDQPPEEPEANHSAVSTRTGDVLNWEEVGRRTVKQLRRSAPATPTGCDMNLVSSPSQLHCLIEGDP
jgi:hypothetical protein